jgi:tetratricopeptide (TPR) repeat protein
VLVALGGYELGREDQIEEQLGRAAALVADRRASRAKATVWSARARHAYLAGRVQEAHDFAAEALELATSLGADEIRSESLLYLGGAKVDGGDPTGIEEMRESLAVAKSINSAVMITRALNNLSIVLRLAGHVEESAAAADEGVSVAERFGMASQLLFARGAVPFRHYEQGRWDEATRGAEAYLEEVGDRYEGVGNEASTRFALAHIALARDDGATALEHTQRAVDAANATLAALPKYPAHVVRGYVLAALGRVDDARRILLELIDLHRKRGERAPWGGDGIGVWSWQQVGLLDEMLDGMGRGWVTPWLEAARTVAAEGWVAALPTYERIGTRTSVAFARLQAGRDADLRAALDFYRPLRASFYVRQAEAKLAAIA